MTGEVTRYNLEMLQACVIIPTYNNRGTVASVVSETLTYCSDVIVVDDGSSDGTASILSEFGDKIDVVTHPVNRGKGAALVSGFRHALKRGFKYAITLDSDGQHYPTDLPLFATAIMHYPGNIIVGERDLSGVDINGKSSFANKFSNFWFYVQTGRKLKDTQTGYRAYPLEKVVGLDLITSRYEAELELMVFASWNNVGITPIPIHVYYPPQSERVSHFKPAYDFTRISILNTLLCILAIVYGLPKRIYYALKDRKLFQSEFRPFTRKNGTRREANITIRRLLCSLYSLLFFVINTCFIFTPAALCMFAIGKLTEKKKLFFHKLMRRGGDYISYHIPDVRYDCKATGSIDFSKPSVIICNHQSHLDLMCMLMLNPKIIFLTNDWVWHSKIFGKLIRYAEYYPTTYGIDHILPNLRELVNRGYSIMIFPEGTRSLDCSILRFHQGAFYIAQKLGIDVTPLYLHGAGDVLPKRDTFLRRGVITLSAGERIPVGTLDADLKAVTREMRKMYCEQYRRISAEIETASYYKDFVKYKYAYLGWRIFSRCKREQELISQHYSLIDSDRMKPERILIINSRQGEFAMLYAMVHKNAEVTALEESLTDHNVAVSLGCPPANLRYLNISDLTEYQRYAGSADKVIVLQRSERDAIRFAGLNAEFIAL